MITSETSAGATPACSSAALIAVAPSVGVGTPVNWPRKEPIAVRLAPTMTMSDMGASRWDACAGLARQVRDYGPAAAMRQTVTWRRGAAFSIDDRARITAEASCIRS